MQFIARLMTKLAPRKAQAREKEVGETARVSLESVYLLSFSNRKNLVTYSLAFVFENYLICSHHPSSWLSSNEKEENPTLELHFFPSPAAARSEALQNLNVYGKAKLQQHVNRYEKSFAMHHFFQLENHLRNRCNSDFPM